MSDSGDRRRAAENLRGIKRDEHLRDSLRDYFDGAVFDEMVTFLTARGLLAGSRVVDVGCGFGAFLERIVATADAFGIERSALEAEIAERRSTRTRRRVIRGDAQRLPLRTGSLDLVTYLHVLEHVDDLEAVVAEAVRVLAPGGAIYLVTPNYGFVFWEPHYHVPWLPLFPRALAARYLRAIGRDHRYLLDSIRYRTHSEVIASLRRWGLRVEFPRTRKIDDPRTIRRGRLASVIRAARRLGLAGPLRRLAVGPLQGTTEILAIKPLEP